MIALNLTRDREILNSIFKMGFHVPTFSPKITLCNLKKKCSLELDPICNTCLSNQTTSNLCKLLVKHIEELILQSPFLLKFNVALLKWEPLIP